MGNGEVFYCYILSLNSYGGQEGERVRGRGRRGEGVWVKERKCRGRIRWSEVKNVEGKRREKE